MLTSELFCCYRYASLYFCCAIEDQDNELITLEIIHRYVELLDKYFGSVSEFLYVLAFLFMPTTFLQEHNQLVIEKVYLILLCGLLGQTKLMIASIKIKN